VQLAALVPGECTLDLIVVGCGPAGLGLAAEAAKKGLSVGLIGPDVPFVNNYGVWVDEFESKLLIPSMCQSGRAAPEGLSLDIIESGVPFQTITVSG
jgi:hypothetical protein